MMTAASVEKKECKNEAQCAQYSSGQGRGGDKGSTTAHVKVELASGLTITSSITNKAVDELALKVGDSVSTVIKSSDVMIGK